MKMLLNLFGIMEKQLWTTIMTLDKKFDVFISYFMENQKAFIGLLFRINASRLRKPRKNGKINPAVFPSKAKPGNTYSLTMISVPERVFGTVPQGIGGAKRKITNLLLKVLESIDLKLIS